MGQRLGHEAQLRTDASPSSPPSQPPSLSPPPPPRSPHTSHAAFDIDRWYPLLSPLTFPTHFLPLPPPTAIALTRYYRTAFLSRPSLTPSDPPHLRALRLALHSLYTAHPSLTRCGAFVRCSRRSPKDGDPLHPSTLQHHFNLQCARLIPRTPALLPPQLANQQLIAYTTASLHSLCSYDAGHALHLLMTSERIFVDLTTALNDAHKQGEGEGGEEGKGREGEGWQTTVSVREWDSRVDPALEFRCFVHHQRLTAISQYHYHCLFPLLQDPTLLRPLQLCIARYWARSVRPLLPPHSLYTSYVLDVVLQQVQGEGGVGMSSGAPQWGCRVVELNPFDVATSACLFQWGVDGGVLRGVDGEGEGGAWEGGFGEGAVGEWVKGVKMRVRTELPRGIEDYVEAVLQQAGLVVDGGGGEVELDRLGGVVASQARGSEEEGGDRWEEVLREVERKAGLSVGVGVTLPET